MTEEEKEEIYQRALRHRRIFLRVAAAVFIGLLVFLLARCHARPRYSEREIRSILEERYGVIFVLQPLEEKGTYRIRSDAWPELEGTARDVWYEGYWDSLLPVWHFPLHTVEDSLRSEAWERYAVPVLAEYGLDAEIPLGSDLDKLAEDLAGATDRIREAPVFSNLLAQGERIGYWRVLLTMAAGEEFRVEESFFLDEDWTEETVREKLGEMERRLEKWMERELK